MIKITEGSGVMTVGLELKNLCEECINILNLLKEDGSITEEELQLHLKNKLDFVQSFQEDIK